MASPEEILESAARDVEWLEEQGLIFSTGRVEGRQVVLELAGFAGESQFPEDALRALRARYGPSVRAEAVQIPSRHEQARLDGWRPSGERAIEILYPSSGDFVGAVAGERDGEVRVGVIEDVTQGASALAYIGKWAEVRLVEPLGNRRVVDGARGVELREVTKSVREHLAEGLPHY